MTADEDEPGRADVWGNASSYFGAVEATSAEVLANAAAWLDKEDFVNTFVSAADPSVSMELMVGRAHGLADNLSYDGLACSLDLFGPQWGRLLADQQSNY
ncbi:MAG: hypothetical protein ACR2JW_12655 [Thermomicrobiales bacterium]